MLSNCKHFKKNQTKIAFKLIKIKPTETEIGTCFVCEKLGDQMFAALCDSKIVKYDKIKFIIKQEYLSVLTAKKLGTKFVLYQEKERIELFC